MFGDLIFRQLFDATSSTYTYLLGCSSTRQAVIIDTAFEQHLRDQALIDELGLKLVAVLDTLTCCCSMSARKARWTSAGGAPKARNCCL